MSIGILIKNLRMHVIFGFKVIFKVGQAITRINTFLYTFVLVFG